MDVYDEAITILTAVAGDYYEPVVLESAWGRPERTEGGCLFDYTGWDPDLGEVGRIPGESGGPCGCLTQVRAGYAFGPAMLGHQDMLERLRADERVPNRPEDLTLESLTALAEWQREVDRVLGRPAPVWDPDLRRYVRATEFPA